MDAGDRPGRARTLHAGPAEPGGGEGGHRAGADDEGTATDHVGGAELGQCDQDRAEVTRTVRRVVDKILHTPTVQVKKLGSADGVNYAEALAVLFNLPAGSSAPVSRSLEPGDAGLARIGNMLSGEAS